MVINLNPFNHNNYSTTPRRGDTSENEPQTEQENALPDRLKLEDLQEDPKLLSHLEVASSLDTNIDGQDYEPIEASTTIRINKPHGCSQCPKRFSKKENLHVS